MNGSKIYLCCYIEVRYFPGAFNHHSSSSFETFLIYVRLTVHIMKCSRFEWNLGFGYWFAKKSSYLIKIIWDYFWNKYPEKEGIDNEKRWPKSTIHTRSHIEILLYSSFYFGQFIGFMFSCCVITKTSDGATGIQLNPKAKTKLEIYFNSLFQFVHFQKLYRTRAIRCLFLFFCICIAILRIALEWPRQNWF